jgi:hypothetical protein
VASVALAPAPAPAVPRKECPKVSAMAAADEPFWHILAQPGACWTLTSDDPARDLVVEAYDARMVGDADVARLRVTYNGPSGPEDLGGRDGWPQQVAVTKKGAWFLDRKADDPAITKALGKAPTYADAPHLVEPGKTGKAIFVRKGKTARGEIICFGHEASADPGPCPGGCRASLCVSRTGGFVVAEGDVTPTGGRFVQRGYQPEGAPAPAPKKP